MPLGETGLEGLFDALIINQRRHPNGIWGIWQEDKRKSRDDTDGVTEKFHLAADSDLQNTVQMTFFHLQDALWEEFPPHLQSGLGWHQSLSCGRSRG